MISKETLVIFSKKLNSPYVIPGFLDKNHFPSLDGWRAVAIILVVVGHSALTTSNTSFYKQFVEIFIYHSFGVRIFFVLSGFLITSLLIKENIKYGKINIKNFFIKRTLRIFPVLYLYMFTLFILDSIFGLGLKLDYFLGPLLYINNFEIFERTWLTGHTWSLAVEEQFYLLWPFVFNFIASKTWIFCLSFIFTVPFLNMWWYFNPAVYQVTLAPFISNADAIFTGSLLAILSFKGFFSENQKIWSSGIITSTSLLIILTVYFFTTRGIFGIVLLPFGSITMNLLIGFLILQSILSTNTFIYRLLNQNFMVKIGLISYSLYIWQQLFLIPLDNMYNAFSNWSIFPINILLSFIMAYISYHLFEKYFLNMKTKFVKSPI